MKTFFIARWRQAFGLAAMLLNFNFHAGAALATAWHIPDSTELGFNMRNPEYAIGTNTTVTFYTGFWKYNGATELANQTGGTMYYKMAAQTNWSSAGLIFSSNTSANQYWQVSLNTSAFSAYDVVQYYFLLTFDGLNGVTNTCLYSSNNISTTTGSASVAAASPYSFAITNGLPTSPVLTVNGANADYTTEHLFVDEVAGGSVPVSISFTPGTINVTEADVYSNLNRRNLATLATTDSNGVASEEGIAPPNGNYLATGDDSHYYKAYAMTNLGGGQYSLTLNATNCGAYRLTARYQVAGNTNWFWYGLRDHCIVVTPARARDITMYELNAMNIDAQGTNQSDRSTFTDLYNGPGSRPYDPVTNRFNLTYFQNLGVNWLWFQPIHPIGVQNRLIDPNTGQPYVVGSPYDIKNFFQVNPLLSKANTRAAAMQEFTNFVAAANANHINVMLDEPFADCAWDCELDTAGTNYFAPTAQPTDLFENTEARFFSRTNEYDQRGSSAANVAVSPDRYDFGKWDDVAHIYSGRYAALVPNLAQENNYTNEADWFDTSIGNESSTGSGNGHFDHITQNVWRYFSDCLLYWLDQTGCPSNTPPNLTANLGIGGLRADFGQGLPPQCWEYIINKVRTRKWDFVFMTESLDGGNVTYRSNRHFDVLNENLVDDLQSAAVASDYRNDFDARRSAYGQSLILLNNVSHDETNYGDPYQALIRYMACSTIDGAPMVFYGQDLGISTTFGFDEYQLNFGKMIPNFMVYNDLQPICTNQTFGLQQLNPVYAAINQARNFSAALKSSNRYYLNQTGSETPQNSIFSVAKYQTANAAPNFSDVVFAFTTLDRNNSQTGFFDVNITQNGANLFGIQPNRIYNVKNISAYTAADWNRRNYWLWPTNIAGSIGGVAGSNVLANGIYVGLNPVPTTNAGWTNAPFEAQYLKLYDVTPPPALSAAPGIGSTNNYIMGNTVTFSWPAVTDVQGGISGYNVKVGTTAGGADVTNVFVTGTSLTVRGSYGAHLYATVTPVNNASIASTTSTTSAGIALVNPAWVPVASMASQTLLNWSSVSGQVYQVWSTTNLTVPFTAYSGMLTAAAPALTFTNNPTNAVQYFKVQLLP